MQLVIAIIQPFILDRLTRTLRNNSFGGYTISQVQGSGRSTSLSPDYLHTHVKIEIAANDTDAPKAIELISEAIGTHKEAEGIVYAIPLLHFANAKTGLHGPEALTRK